MKKIVIMPGGFHPFHAGHLSLYNAAKQAFPDAEVFVAATDDTSKRPFPFQIKQKLAQLAGVDPAHFFLVKSPFQSKEITQHFDPDNTALIYVRSEKDRDKPPQAGGVKKSGEPAYLQPLTKDLEPMSKHAYMTYLPTVEFGPGITSATEIRTAWPTLNDKRKQAMVMSLYPKTQGNPKLVQNVIKMLDTAIGTQLNEFLPAIGAAIGGELAAGAGLGALETGLARAAGSALGGEIEQAFGQDDSEDYLEENSLDLTNKQSIIRNMIALEYYSKAKAYSSTMFGFTVAKSYFVGQAEDAIKSFEKQYGKQGVDLLNRFRTVLYPMLKDLQQSNFAEWQKNGLFLANHADDIINSFKEITNRRIGSSDSEAETNPDYLEEKWSERYKRSINCNNPKGFSQRAHCAGRKKKVNESSGYSLAGSFTHDLTQSKVWLITELAKIAPTVETIYILGSWYGNLSLYLNLLGDIKFNNIINVEKNQSMLDQSERMLEHVGIDNVDSMLADANTLDYRQLGPAGAVINCSLTDMPGTAWFRHIPDGTIVALQARDHDPGFQFHSTDDILHKFPLDQVLYTGTRQFEDPQTKYHRFMVIGRK